MSGPRFAGNLLAMPHFADEARFRLDEAAGMAEVIDGAIAAAGLRIREGGAGKVAAFDLVTAHPAVQVLAALAEVTEADRAYVYSALETPEAVRAAVEALVAGLQARAGLQAGLRAAVPALEGVRAGGVRYTVEVDVGMLLEWIGFAVIEGEIDLATGDWAEVSYEATRSILEVMTTPLDVAGELIYQQGARLIRLAVLTAVAELVRHNGHHLCYTGDGFDPVLRFSDVTNDIRVDVDLHPRLFESPDQAPFITRLRERLTQWWTDCGLGLVEARSITSRQGAYFTAALASEWRPLVDAYGELAAYLDDSVTPLTAPTAGWLFYRTRLRRRPHEAVFADTFSLAQVWQPLRAWWSERDDAISDRTFARRPHSRIQDHDLSRKCVGRAVDVIGNWLAARDANDALRVVSGGPGAGKSSLARMVAAHRATLGERVLLIELFHFELAESLEAAVNRFACAQGLLHDLLPHQEPGPLLIIFDGLDELSIRGSAGREAVTTLIDDVRDLLRDHNRERCRVQALLLGREVVVQGVAGRFRGTGQVLHVMRYVVPEDERGQYHDPDGLLAEDQRDGWWQAYGACKGRDYDGFPLAESKVAPLTTEPLLNYLVAIAMDGGLDLCHGEASLTDVYGALLRKVFDRVHATDGGRLAGVEAVEPWAFEEFLRAVAVVAWHGEGRVATMPEIVGRCPPAVLEQMQVLEKGAESAVSRLIAAFYFRQPRDAQPGARAFEFTHQSFAEYLIAREIVSFLEILRDEAETNRRRSRRGWTHEAQLAEWARLFGPAAIAPNTFEFVLDGLRGLDADDVKSILAVLNGLLGRVVTHDFPLSALGTEGFAGAVLARSRNAGEALLALASGCAEVVEGWVAFDMPQYHALGTWLRRLHLRSAGQEQRLVSRRLVRLDLNEARLEGAELYGVNLNASCLKGASLDLANLTAADLAEVQLQGATLAEANLHVAFLGGADLRHARLSRANLSKASLEEADLMGAHLDGADLRGTLLSTANLNGALLHGALFDTTTRWPSGFDPIAAGACLIPR